MLTDNTCVIETETDSYRADIFRILNPFGVDRRLSYDAFSNSLQAVPDDRMRTE
jgi:hypothetical protein